jgi:hypothetical protein
MSGRLESFSLPNLSLFIVKVLTGEYHFLSEILYLESEAIVTIGSQSGTGRGAGAA